MEKDKIQAIIYLENKLKIQDKDILVLKNTLMDEQAESRANEKIIKSLEKTNERLLKTIEQNNVWKGA